MAIILIYYLNFVFQDKRNRAEVLRGRGGRVRHEAEPGGVGGAGGDRAGRPGLLLQVQVVRRQEKIIVDCSLNFFVKTFLFYRVQLYITYL